MNPEEKDHVILQLQRRLESLQRKHAVLEFRLQYLEARVNRLAEHTGCPELSVDKRIAGMADRELRDWTTAVEEQINRSARRN